MVDSLNLDNLTVDESGRVSFSGLSSGIDLQGTVDAIITAKRIPIDTLETRVADNEAQIAALEDLQVNLETLRTSLSSLYGAVSFGNSTDIFSGKQVFASSSRIDGATPSAAGNLLGVTVGNDAAVGNHTVEVLQVARAHKISSDNVTSATTSLGFGAGDEFTISSNRTKTNFESAIFSSGSDTIGSSGTLSFVDETGTAIGTVAYTSTDTLDDLASSISANVTGVTGTVESASGGFRLDLTSATEFRFSESGAGTALTDFELSVRKVGISATTTLLDLRDLINQANTGSNATGINASVVTVSATESYLVMTAEDTGVTMSLGETTGTPLQTVGLLTSGSAIKNTLQTPQNAQVYADGILDQTNTVYESSFQTASTVQVGSAGTLTFTRDSDSAPLGTVNYTATDSLSDLAAAITTNITDVTATVVTDGAGVRLEITATNGTTITETASGTALDDLGINNKRRAIERSSNTIDDLFTGVTLSLFAAEAGTVISLDIEQDLSQVKSQIVTFVESYNAVRQFINSHRLVDETTGTADEESGVLFSSTALSEVGRALSLIVGQGATGVDQNFTVLSQIGVNFVDRSASDPLLAENLEIDETTLDAVLLSNPDDVRKMFNFDFTSGDSRVTLLGFDGNTTYEASGYTLNLKPGSGDNLLQYSEQADNAYYTQTLMSVSANATAAPDSTTTADGLIASAAAGPHTLSSSTINVTAGESYVLSAYVKEGDVAQVRLGLSGAGAPSNAYADFNVNTGALDSHGTGADTTTIEDAGNGFYRVSVTVTAATTGTATFDITPKDTSSGVGFTGDGSTVNTYVWGMQANEPATDTTEITAFTNTRATINTDVGTTTAPDGTSTADAIVSDATNDTHLIESNPSISVTAGESYTYTTYAKAGARDKIRFGMGGTNFGSNAHAEFDLNLGTNTLTGSDLTSASIENAGSGWYRISVTATANSSGTTPFEIYPMDAAGITFTGDGVTEDTFFWEPHVLDSGDAVAGNYVPTTSAAVSGGLATANINGVATGADDTSASITGNSITVNSGGAQGLQLFFSGLDFTTSIQLDFTIGIAAQMFFEIDDLLDTTTGIVDGEIDQLTDQNVVNNERITEMEARLEIQRQSLLERYIAMETALAQANNIMESITQSTTALLNSQSA